MADGLKSHVYILLTPLSVLNNTSKIFGKQEIMNYPTQRSPFKSLVVGEIVGS